MVAFLFTDIEGSTSRWERDSAAMRMAVERYLAILESTIAAHHGVLYKRIGDGAQAAFATAQEGLRAAFDAQRALLAEAWPDPPGPILVRMALHVGAAEPRDGDYLTPVLNRLARLMAAGHGGQILLTLAAANLAGDALPIGASLRELGEHRLRDLQHAEPVFQLLHPALPTDFPPLKTLDVQRHNLPQQATEFIGRAADVARVVDLVQRQGVRLLTLTGPGGVGKTRLALEAAARLTAVFLDGIWFIDLAPLHDPRHVPQTLAEVLGVREEPGQPLANLLAQYLRSRKLLLVFDNFEHVAEAARFVAELLAQAPGAKALVTSRAPLRLRGEQELPVHPLEIPQEPGNEESTQDALARSEAVQLFVARVQTVRPDFALTPESAATVGEICRRLDGLPLAIELAAARIRILSPKDLLARLDDRLRVLTGGPRDAPARQQALRETIAWSHDLLAEDERALFRSLAVFAGSATLESVEAVAGADAALDALDGLSALVEQSLVQLDDAGSVLRFGMLQTIRAFGLEQLAAHGEEQRARDAHAGYFTSVVLEARPEVAGPEQGAWFDRFETEHDDLRVALRWLLDRGDVNAVRIVGMLWAFWWIRGYLSEGADWLRQALALDVTADPSARALALVGAGTLAETQGDYDGAAALHQEALSLAQAHGADLEAARALVGLAVVAQDRGDYHLAGEQFDAALALFRRCSDEAGMAQALLGLGALAAYQGDTRRAVVLLEEGGERLAALGDRWGQGLAKANLGRLAYLEGDLDRAGSQSEEALTIFRQLGDKANIALLLSNLGEVWQLRQETDRAAALYEEGLTLFRELGDKRNTAATLVTLAEAEVARGNLARAEALLRESLQAAGEVEDKEGTARGLEAAAALATARGALATATRALAAADALREAIGAPLPAVYRPERDRILADSRRALGGPAFAGAWAAGRGLSAIQVLAAGLG
jgi:predicted ATPase/class 3 adenylate cyclase